MKTEIAVKFERNSPQTSAETRLNLQVWCVCARAYVYMYLLT